MTKERLSDEELTEMRERSRKGTPGKWVNDINEVRTTYLPNRKPVITRPDMDGINDAKFIAHARQDIPKLLAEIERLKSELSSLCPIGDLDVVTTLQVEKRYLTEVIAEKDAEIERLREKIEEAESLLDEANIDYIELRYPSLHEAIYEFLYGGDDE